LINYKNKENEKFLLAMITVMGVATSCAQETTKKVKPQLLKWLK
jgi:hypothetical protein